MLWKATLLGVSLAVVAPNAAAAQKLVPPDVPANLIVPAGARPVSIASAAGTQNYICLSNATGMVWAFLGPQATLFGDRDEQLMTHYLSGNPAESFTPRATWQDSSDTSAVWAVAIAQSSDPAYVADGAVPWLLLRVVGAQYGPQWGDRLIRTTYIQRVNTSGGRAPIDGCDASTDVGKRALVPYTTQYVFYR